MPFPPNAMLNGLRRAPLLNNDDYFQEQPPIGMEPGSTDAPSFRMGAPDPRLTLDAFQSRMQDELRNRAFQAARLGERDEVGALGGLLRSYGNDQTTSQIGRQREQVAGIDAANTEASMSGFGTPQNAARYGRAVEQQKIMQPQATAVAQAEAQSKGQVDIQNALSGNFIKQLEAQARIARESGGNVPPISRMSVGKSGSSIGYDTNQTDNSPRAMSGAAGLAGDLPRLRYLAEGGNPAAVAAYQTAKQSALAARTDLSPDTRQAAYDAVDFPAFKGMQPAQIINELRSGRYGDVSQTSPQDWLQLQEALNLLAGSPLPQ